MIQNRFKIIVFESYTMLFPLLHHQPTHILNISFVLFFPLKSNDVHECVATWNKEGKGIQECRNLCYSWFDTCQIITLSL